MSTYHWCMDIGDKQHRQERLIAQLNAVYNAHRDSLLNRKYYGHQLQIYRRYEQVMEITLAVVTSSAISSWAIWHNVLGGAIWAVLSALAAVLAVMKPFLELPKQIERFSKLYTGYSENYSDLSDLVIQIDMEQDVKPEVLQRFAAAQERIRAFAPEHDPKPIARLVSRYTHEVNEELPFKNYWYPSNAPKEG